MSREGREFLLGSRWRFLAPWRSLLLLAWALVACSAAPKPVGAGGQCLLVTDCQLGLVCVKNRCSNDLSGIVNVEDAAARVPVPPAGGDGGTDASGSTDSAGTGDDASAESATGAESADDATEDVGPE